MKNTILKLVGQFAGFAGMFLIALIISSPFMMRSVNAQNKGVRVGAEKKAAESKRAGKKSKNNKKGKSKEIDDDEDEPRVVRLSPRSGEFKASDPISKTASAFGITPAIGDISETSKTEREFDGEPVIREEENNEVEVIRTVENAKLDKQFTDPLAFLSRLTNAPSSPQAMPGPALSFNGILSNDLLTNFGTTSMPPDTVGDVGPNHYVQATNFGVFRVFSKNGTPLTPIATISTLFTGLPANDPCRVRNDGDPVVNYDPLADRWMVSQFYVNNPSFGQCIAVSQTGDPTGAWYAYDFPSPAGNFPDYPHWAVWTDGYYLATHEFNAAGTAYVAGGFYAFNRAKMLVGDPTANFIYYSDANSYGHLPADVDGYAPPATGTTELFLELDALIYGGADQIIIHELVPDFNTPANSTFTLKTPVPIAPYDPRDPSGRSDIEQPVVATSAYLDSVAGRFMYRVAYRNIGTTAAPVNSYVTNLTVNVSGVTPSTAATYQAAIRWEELRRNSAGELSVFDQGTHAPDPVNASTGRNRWMGSIAQDNQGNLAVGFSRSGRNATDFPDIVWAGRTGGQVATGTLNEGEMTMKASTGYQSSGNRWGDYSAMTVDPTDDCTFWYTQEWRDSANNGTTSNAQFKWSTQIANFKFPSCTAAPKGQIAANVTDCNTGQPINGAAVLAQAGGFLRLTNASGNLISNIISAPGDYTVSAFKKGYTSSSSVPVTVTNGGITTANVCLSGAFTILELASTPSITPVDENANSRLDPGETATLSVPLRNIGGLDATSVTATLTTSTPGVTILPPQTVSYPNIPNGGGTGNNTTPFKFKLDRNSFACGSSITFTLTVNYNGTSAAQTFNFTIPSISPFKITTALDSTPPPPAPEYTATTGTQTGRLARANGASSCTTPKATPALQDSTTGRRYDAYTFTASAAGCITVTLDTENALLYTAAYNGTYNPTSIRTNYLADPGTSGTTSTYSFNVVAGQQFTVVVHEVTAGTAIGQNYTLSLSGPVERGCQVYPQYEGDVTTRPNGDEIVNADDVQQIRNFSVGMGLPYRPFEFQRADCSPRSSSGNGVINGDDVQQARRYSFGTDAIQIAGGPTLSALSSAESKEINKKTELPFGMQSFSAQKAFAAPAALRVDSQNTSRSSTLVVPVRVDTVGNEVGYTFSLLYDSTRLTNPQVAIGNAGGDVVANTSTAGQIGFSVTEFPGGAIAAGNNIILVNVTFTVATNAESGPTPITFTNAPAQQRATGVDPDAPITQPTYTGGSITIAAPTAAGVSISGQVLTSKETGLAGAVVQLTDQAGNTRTARTNSFGYFSIGDVEAGQTVTITVISKRYRFESQVVNLIDNLVGLNFTSIN